MDLGRAIGVTVIAEGVQSSAQADLLRDLGCTAAQGPCWGSPLLLADALACPSWRIGFDVAAAPTSPVRNRRAPRQRVGKVHGIDRLLSLHCKGASLSTIAASLNADGYLTPKGVRWHQTSVARAISDEDYARPREGPGVRLPKRPATPSRSTTGL